MQAGACYQPIDFAKLGHSTPLFKTPTYFLTVLVNCLFYVYEIQLSSKYMVEKLHNERPSVLSEPNY